MELVNIGGREMNYIKLQQDIIKQVINKPTKRTFVGVAKYNVNFTDNIVIITEHSAFFIPEDYFWLDYEKLSKELREFTSQNIESFLHADKQKYAIKTNESRTLDKAYCKTKKPITCSIFKIKDEDVKVFINDKLLTYFNGDNNYKAVSAKAPVYVYENETLVGFALPVNVLKEAE